MNKSNSEPTTPFEGLRGGVRHRYDVRADALYYSATDSSSPKQARVDWSELEWFTSGYGGALYLVLRSKQTFGVWIARDAMPAFCAALLTSWAAQNASQAKAAAADYVGGGPGLGWFLLLVACGLGAAAGFVLRDGQLILGLGVALGAAVAFAYGVARLADRRPFREAVRAAGLKIQSST